MVTSNAGKSTPRIVIGLEQLLVPVGDLALLDGNPRRGDVDAVARSLDAFGQRKPIVVRRADRTVIAGNHTLRAARQLGWPDVAVVWVDDDEVTAKAFSLADNRTGDLARYDDELLAEMMGEVQIDPALFAVTGWTNDELALLLAPVELLPPEPSAERYMLSAKSPVYEPTGAQPAVSDLYNRAWADELIAEIDATELPEEVATFLHAAAERHVRFSFRDVAEFYAHADADVQRLMERSALVIIDFHQALQLGYAQLNETVAALYDEDYGNDA